MKVYDVALSALAKQDLDAIYDWTAEHAGAAIAYGFLTRIKARLLTLQHFPQRGTRRDDLLPGMRVFGLDRRVTIAFRVEADSVTVLRILYGGRDLKDIVQDTSA